MKSKRVTLVDIADAVGVSTTTVSLVLSGRAQDLRISAGVAQRVRVAAERLGYQRNAAPLRSVAGATRTIGFVSDAVATSRLAGDMIRGALEAARDRGFVLFVAETEGDAALERTLLQSMRERHVHGLVLASTRTRFVEVPQGLGGTAAVLLNALPAERSSLPSIVPDEVEAGRAAARVLLDAGHREGIHLVGTGPDLVNAAGKVLTAVERLNGLYEVFGAAGVKIGSDYLSRSSLPEHGFEATRDLLARTGPRALVCLNDRIALGAYQALQDAGLRVPADVSVVSFDDDPVASWMRPGLTTVALPHYELGVKAVEVLFAEDAYRGVRRSPGPGVVHRVPMPVRVRDSVARPDDRPTRSRAGASLLTPRP